jgi:hypothetical protein
VSNRLHVQCFISVSIGPRIWQILADPFFFAASGATREVNARVWVEAVKWSKKVGKVGT